MKAGIVGASGYTGVGAVAAAGGPSGLRGGGGDRPFPCRPAGGGAHAVPGGGVPRPGLRGERPRPSSTGSTWCSAPCPTASPSGSCPSCGIGSGAVVDLAADFRLHDPSLYPRWYGEEHAAPELLGRRVYGLPELFRDDLPGATLVAAAGCYPTAAGLALAPLVRRGWSSRPASWSTPQSGVSGAGRGPRSRLHFGTVDEDFTAYGLLTHRHTPEMEQMLRVRGAVHAPPRPHGPRHPGHVLRRARPRGAGVSTADAVLDVLARGLRRRALRRRDRRLAVDQGHGGVERGPRDAPGSTRGRGGS